MYPNFDPKLFAFLSDNKLSFDYYQHIPIFTVEEWEAVKHTIPGKHTKNLFLTDKKWGFYLVSIESHKRFPVNAFRKYLWLKDLSFGTPEQLYETLKLTPGSVSLFWLIYDQPATLNVFIDHDLWIAPLVWRHPNRNDATICVSHEKLVQFLRCTGHEGKVIKFDEERIII
jgi:Ala-tRNA(Pro) deacylase